MSRCRLRTTAGLAGLLALLSLPSRGASVDPAWLVSLGVTLGGSPAAASIGGLAVDSRGDSVVVGTTNTRQYPGIDSSRTTNGGIDLRFVARIDSTGVQRIVTVVGSPGIDVTTRSWELFGGMAMDASDNAYVVAFDVPHDVPAGGQYRAASPRPFVYRVTPLGAVTRYSTPLDPAVRSVRSIAVDAAGNVVLTGSADGGLVTTPGVSYPTSAVGPQCIAPYALKLGPASTAPVYATYLAYAGTQGAACATDLGPTMLEPSAYAVAVDAPGNAWITGQAEPGARAQGGGVDLAPVTLMPHAAHHSSATHAFVTKLGANGTVVWSARLGGTNVDRGTSVVLDPSGNVYVGGKTTSNRSFPTSGAALFQPSQYYGCLLNTPEFGFISKLPADATRVLWSGLLPGDGSSIDDCGGGFDIVPTVLASDGNGGVFAAGFNTSNHMVNMSRNNPMADDGDAFFAQIDAAGTVLYSTWMTMRASTRAMAVDRDGNVRVAGGTFLRQLSPNRVPVEVSARALPACAGSTLMLDARVAAAGNVGAVEFTVDGALGGTVPARAGMASLATTLAAGVHRVQVRYQGASPFDGARSPLLYLPVHQAGLC